MLTDTIIYRDSESEYLSTLSSSLTQGTTWERIAALVELENSQSKTIGRNGPGQLLSPYSPSSLANYTFIIFRHYRSHALQGSVVEVEEGGDLCPWRCWILRHHLYFNLRWTGAGVWCGGSRYTFSGHVHPQKHRLYSQAPTASYSPFIPKILLSSL